MKKTLIVLILIACSDLLSTSVHAQKKFASIEKNVNNSANNLFHDLNKTKDTLILRGDKNIRYVYSINKSYKREINQLINASSAKVPLTHLTKGKHVFVVEQMPLKIVFVIKVFGDKKTELDTSTEIVKITASSHN
ncbi:MAG: hypothetical protein GXO84_04580 [Chlorobi bacterium]|nr:hypothetical protein [Chlorobiota bacterium]